MGELQEMVRGIMNHLVKANKDREEKARKRIREAVVYLTAKGRVTVLQIQRLTGCSFNTVYRHADLYADVRHPRIGRPRKVTQ